jgi:hypothetical protein
VTGSGASRWTLLPPRRACAGYAVHRSVSKRSSREFHRLAPTVAAVIVAVSREKLEGAHCWLDHDQVRGHPELTEFRRGVRYHHAMWRMANGYPIGTHRVRPGTPPRLVGSHLDLDFARESGATFLTTSALTAARARTSFVEPHQIFDHQSFWADLLSSEAMAVNLVRGPRRRRRSSRPSRSHVVAGDAGPGHRGALRPLARPPSTRATPIAAATSTPCSCSPSPTGPTAPRLGISPSAGRVVMTLDGNAVPTRWAGSPPGWCAASRCCTS